MAAADEAELRGDAAAALAVIEQHLFGPDGKIFWRRERILRLSQLELFGPWLPAWVTSRWLLEQALQSFGPSKRTATERALRVAVEI
jgi:hypothetical protein